MGRAVACDPHAGAHNADVMLTDFSDGTTVGLCREAFLNICLAVIEQAAEAEAADTAAEAERRLSNANPPTHGRSSRKSKREAERPESHPSNDEQPSDTPEDGMYENPAALGAGDEQPSETPEGTEA